MPACHSKGEASRGTVLRLEKPLSAHPPAPGVSQGPAAMPGPPSSSGPLVFTPSMCGAPDAGWGCGARLDVQPSRSRACAGTLPVPPPPWGSATQPRTGLAGAYWGDRALRAAQRLERPPGLRGGRRWHPRTPRGRTRRRCCRPRSVPQARAPLRRPRAGAEVSPWGRGRCCGRGGAGRGPELAAPTGRPALLGGGGGGAGARPRAGPPPALGVTAGGEGSFARALALRCHGAAWRHGRRAARAERSGDWRRRPVRGAGRGREGARLQRRERQSRTVRAGRLPAPTHPCPPARPPRTGNGAAAQNRLLWHAAVGSTERSGRGTSPCSPPARLSREGTGRGGRCAGRRGPFSAGEKEGSAGGGGGRWGRPRARRQGSAAPAGRGPGCGRRALPGVVSGREPCPSTEESGRPPLGRSRFPPSAQPPPPNPLSQRPGLPPLPAPAEGFGRERRLPRDGRGLLLRRSPPPRRIPPGMDPRAFPIPGRGRGILPRGRWAEGSGIGAGRAPAPTRRDKGGGRGARCPRGGRGAGREGGAAAAPRGRPPAPPSAPPAPGPLHFLLSPRSPCRSRGSAQPAGAAGGSPVSPGMLPRQPAVPRGLAAGPPLRARLARSRRAVNYHRHTVALKWLLNPAARGVGELFNGRSPANARFVPPCWGQEPLKLAVTWNVKMCLIYSQRRNIALPLFLLKSRIMAKVVKNENVWLGCVEHTEIDKALITKTGSCFNNLVKL